MTNQLTFKSHTLEAIEHEGKYWFTAATLAIALEYADARSVTNIYNRNTDEFTACMSLVIKMVTSGKINGLQHKKVRVFSLRGAHLIAMFANTPVAKEFRKWVLDLIEKETREDKTAAPIPAANCPRSEKLPSGIYFHQSKYNPYRAYVWHNRKNVYIGCFPTVGDAVLAQAEYRRKEHVNEIIRNNADVIDSNRINARLLIIIEGGEAVRSQILPPDALTTTTLSTLPNLLIERGKTDNPDITPETFRKIAEACMSAMAYRAALPLKQ